MLSAREPAATQVTSVKPMEKRADEENRHIALLHQLGERLTAARNYLKAARRQPSTAAAHHTSPHSGHFFRGRSRNSIRPARSSGICRKRYTAPHTPVAMQAAPIAFAS